MTLIKNHLNNGASDREEVGLVAKRLQGKLKQRENNRVLPNQKYSHQKNLSF